MSCGVGCRCGLDPALLWLWCRLVAVASIRPLAWEPPYAYAVGEALKKQKKKKPGPKILLSKFLEFSGRTAVESSFSQILCISGSPGSQSQW